MNNLAYEQMKSEENTHWWFTARRKIVQSIISDIDFINKEKISILDIGCGTGGNLPMLSTFGNVTGLEMDYEAVKMSKEKGIGEIVHGSIPGNFETSNKYNIITLLDVLEHIENDKQALIDIKKYLLKVDSRLIITVPAFQFLWSQHDVFLHHKRRYTKKILKKVLSEAGYEIKLLSYYNFFLFLPISLVRIVLSIFGDKESSMQDPSKWANKFFYKVFSFERYLLKNSSLPFGVSLITAVEKND